MFPKTETSLRDTTTQVPQVVSLFLRWGEVDCPSLTSSSAGKNEEESPVLHRKEYQTTEGGAVLICMQITSLWEGSEVNNTHLVQGTVSLSQAL